MLSLLDTLSDHCFSERTSSLMRVSTAALSISLRGVPSWDINAMSGTSLGAIFVVCLMDISFCEMNMVLSYEYLSHHICA